MKIARVIGILHKLKHSFPLRILRLIYNSLIHPHLIYGLYLWGFNPKRLTILQKRAVRILARSPYLSHSTPLFKSLQILKLEDLYITQLYKLCSDMTWNFHIKEVSKKISRNIGTLKKLIVPNNILLTIYNTLILPHINYCCHGAVSLIKCMV